MSEFTTLSAKCKTILQNRTENPIRNGVIMALGSTKTRLTLAAIALAALAACGGSPTSPSGRVTFAVVPGACLVALYDADEAIGEARHYIDMVTLGADSEYGRASYDVDSQKLRASDVEAQKLRETYKLEAAECRSKASWGDVER